MVGLGVVFLSLTGGLDLLPDAELAIDRAVSKLFPCQSGVPGKWVSSCSVLTLFLGECSAFGGLALFGDG